MQDDEEESEADYVRAKNAMELRNKIYVVLFNVMIILEKLMSLSNANVGNTMLKTINKLYKVLTLATREVINDCFWLCFYLYVKILDRDHPRLSAKFENMVHTSGNFGAKVSEYVIGLQQNEASSKSKISKEEKAIPQLVFIMEKYEFLVNKLAQKSKVKMRIIAFAY